MRRVLPIVIAVVALCGLLAGSASAQTPACNGDITLIRVSQIKPTSSVAAFMKAQADHLAWYRKNGFTDNTIHAVPVIVIDRTTGTARNSDTEFMSFHVRPPGGATGMSVWSKDQAGWDAYVRQYQDSSDIKSQYVVCVPKNR